MCSPCSIVGKRTRLGSGNSRAVPLKSSSSGTSLGMTAHRGRLVLVAGELGPVGPLRGGRVQRDFRYELLVQFGRRAPVSRHQRLGKAALHLRPEGGDVEAPKVGAEAVHVVPGRMKQL